MDHERWCIIDAEYGQIVSADAIWHDLKIMTDRTNDPSSQYDPLAFQYAEEAEKVADKLNDWWRETVTREATKEFSIQDPNGAVRQPAGSTMKDFEERQNRFVPRDRTLDSWDLDPEGEVKDVEPNHGAPLVITGQGSYTKNYPSEA